MPLRKNRTFIRTAIILSTTLSIAAPASASVTAATGTTGCTPAADTQAKAAAAPSTTKAFARFGDAADYFLAPAGDFETSAAGWNLNGARIVRGNDAERITDGQSSLSLGGGLLRGNVVAVSPKFCVTDEHPYFRYMYKANGLLGALSTFVRYRDADGSTEEVQVRSKTSTSLLPGLWRPSALQPLSVEIPLTQKGGTAEVQLVFRSHINILGSSYQIDSVLVDPYRRG